MTDGPPPQRAEVASSLLQLVQRSLEDSKAFDPVIIDLMGRSSIADYMYIASGRSSPPHWGHSRCSFAYAQE